MNTRALVIRLMRRPWVPALLLVPMLLLGAPPGVARAGKISGQVLDEHGVPVPYARVTIQDAGEAEIAKVNCDEFGFYVTEELPAGKYLLAAASGSFVVPGSRLLPRWYGDAATSRLATPVAVAAEGKTRGIDVHLPRGGTISGRVTAGGAPVAAASVEVIPWEDGNGGSGLTGEDGTYMVDSLEPGSYKLRFRPPGESGLLQRWHPDAAHADGATLVTIGLGEDVAGIAGVLPLGGSISGRVTGVGGVPLAGVWVDRSAVGWLDGGMNRLAETDANGGYRLQGLETASYHVSFRPVWIDGYSEIWYPAQFSREGAALVAVVAGVETPGIDGRLGASIAGRVTNSDGAPVAGMHVNAVDPAFDSWRGESVTDDTGAYLIAGLAPGMFKVCFQFLSEDRIGYLPQCYDGHAAAAGFDPVTVASDQTTHGIDAVIERGGSIAGRLTGAGGIAIAQGQGNVDVYDTAGEYVAWSPVDEEGHYQVLGLPAGTYRLLGTAWESPWTPAWYPGVTGEAAATEVGSGPGLDATGIDWEMPLGGVITGRVTDPGGAAVPDVQVGLVDVATRDWVSDASTDGTGKYRLQGLPAGEYTLSFWPPPGPLLGRWHDGKRTEAKADHLSVQLGQTRTGINARLPRGGSVTGLVTGDGGAPLAGVSVHVESADGAGEYFGASTNRKGRYAVSGMPRGAYRVQFEPGAESGYLGLWYRQRTRSKDADKVVVAEGNVTRGIDARLTRGGRVVGRMTDARGVALGGEPVELYRGQKEIGRSYADPYGFYAIGPLNPGAKYRLRFVPSAGFLVQWYLRRDSAADADPIVVSKAGAKKTVNVQLDRGGVITGRVTAAGDPFRYVEVAAYAAEGGDPVSWGDIDAGGRYRLGGLPTGTYRVKFYPWGEVPFLSQWYDDRPTFEEADPVPVTAGVRTPGIDAVLAPAP